MWCRCVTVDQVAVRSRWLRKSCGKPHGGLPLHLGAAFKLQLQPLGPCLRYTVVVPVPKSCTSLSQIPGLPWDLPCDCRSVWQPPSCWVALGTARGLLCSPGSCMGHSEALAPACLVVIWLVACLVVTLGWWLASPCRAACSSCSPRCSDPHAVRKI